MSDGSGWVKTPSSKLADRQNRPTRWPAAVSPGLASLEGQDMASGQI
jgi:hypothetical protein